MWVITPDPRLFFRVFQAGAIDLMVDCAISLRPRPFLTLESPIRKIPPSPQRAVPMRIYMQTPPSQDGPPKFCHLILEKDLLEGWTLVSETGSQGRAGRVKKLHFQERDAATDAIETQRDSHLRKGFKVVFMTADQF